MPGLSSSSVSKAPPKPKKTLVSLPPTCSLKDAIAALERDGAVIVQGLISQEDANTISNDMEPFLKLAGASNNDFAGFQTFRSGALAARSSTFNSKVLLNPIFLGLAEHTLAKWCERFHIMATQVIKIMPGEKAQEFHRDRQAWGTDLLGDQVEPQLASIWALSEFTKENGATRIVPGTHKRPLDYGLKPTEDDVCYAEMPKGSAVFYTGSAIHSGGANVTKDVPRVGMHVSFAAAWLRQEENQYLSVPPGIAKTLDIRVQELLGYAMADKALGYFSPPRLNDIPTDVENHEAFGGNDTVSPEFALGRRPRKEAGFVKLKL
ncbi:PhyH-domain-containing protein [Gonapodya prolifera JEL478]|uniref:PhyH-domain-containing protein n=1 Tax=Gonapodya prolifera (strain JEL478) TaxID=1344416 RepID=A0A138ZZ69_GONPJ|nr:PhyH-domain-containing protein [Gonapodya prolifera JEL478]|eukprot:KXS09790.1 PhyH-domain-containing protein [Gonapodya prolifera JEL478]